MQTFSDCLWRGFRSLCTVTFWQKFDILINNIRTHDSTVNVLPLKIFFLKFDEIEESKISLKNYLNLILKFFLPHCVYRIREGKRVCWGLLTVIIVGLMHPSPKAARPDPQWVKLFPEVAF